MGIFLVLFFPLGGLATAERSEGSPGEPQRVR